MWILLVYNRVKVLDFPNGLYTGLEIFFLSLHKIMALWNVIYLTGGGRGGGRGVSRGGSRGRGGM